MDTFDYVIVGGGIVGLSIAYKLAQRDNSKNILLIEKENELATEKTVDKVNYVEESSSEEYLRIEKLSVAPVLYLNKGLIFTVLSGTRNIFSSYIL